ncbi:MAG TPA: hypothetical protein VGS58_05115 [Candidatus Sulfopaludibacter sp.]|nr:hypothetical protein [Candidatus Sulfopaludibacter sp.]
MRAALLLAAAIAGAALLPLRAQTAETRQARGKRVVSEALAALGGDSFLHMQDRVESGRAYSFYRAEMSGTSIATIYTRYLAPVPGKVMQRERQSFGREEQDGFVLFTETEAWEVTFHGARPMEPDLLQRYQDSVLRNIFYILRQRLQEPGMEFYSQGTDMYERVPVEIVDITDAAGATVTVYFSQFDKLPVRQVYRRRNAQFRDFDTEETTFAKYRDVTGIKWPYDVQRHRNGDKVYEMYASSVEINKDLKDDLFTLPKNARVLTRKK